MGADGDKLSRSLAALKRKNVMRFVVGFLAFLGARLGIGSVFPAWVDHHLFTIGGEPIHLAFAVAFLAGAVVAYKWK